MRIVSLNAWGGAKFDPLMRWLPEVDADVLCLQEVTRTPGLSGWTTFRDSERSLPQRANLFDDVRRVLPCHQSWFVTSDSGPVQDSTGETHRQHFGLAIFVGEHHPVIGQASRFVHGTFVDHADWAPNDRPRIAQGIRIVDDVTDRRVTLVHVHGLRDPSGKHDTAARHEQARRLASLIDDLREPEDFSVLCGDLNLLPASESFDVLGKVGLKDLVGDADTRTSSYLKPLRHASYLLVSQPTVVQEFEIPAHPEVSDHRPLVLNI